MKRQQLQLLGSLILLTSCAKVPATNDTEPCTPTPWYADEDADGWGDTTRHVEACQAPAGWVASGGDCDDRAPEVFPGAPEVCDLIDDDCDGLVDDADPDLDSASTSTWYADADGDGYGDPATARAACTPSDDETDDGTDCDDTEADVNPGAAEVCDLIDDDCDGLIDEADPDLDERSLYEIHADEDGDGWADEGVVVGYSCWPGEQVGDCDDTRPEANPEAREDCENGLDDDCDGFADECAIVRPAAATSALFQWQGQQDWFWNEVGQLCEGHIALGMSDQALCYADAEGELRCQGTVYTSHWDTFTPLGEGDVQQILMMHSSGDPQGGNLCVRSGTAVRCLGAYNCWGQFGCGCTTCQSSFVTWGDGEVEVAEIATATFDTICALDLDGYPWCAGCCGSDPNSTPVRVSDATGETLYMSVSEDPFVLDLATVYRAQDDRTECMIGGSGMWCESMYGAVGTPGRIVKGGLASVDYTSRSFCWLEDDGVALCADESRVSRTFMAPYAIFEGMTLVDLVGNPNDDGLCGVPLDGSLWCVGSDREGRFGTGDLAVPTEVLPPGTFDLRCW